MQLHTHLNEKQVPANLEEQEGLASVGMPCTSNVFFIDDKTLIVTAGYDEQEPGVMVSVR